MGDNLTLISNPPIRYPPKSRRDDLGGYMRDGQDERDKQQRLWENYRPQEDEGYPKGPSVGKRTLVDKVVPVWRAASGGAGAADPSEAIARAEGSSGAPLPAELAQKFGSALGADLSTVRVHTGAESAQAAEAVAARAYTVGHNIHFAAGQYDPASAEGQKLLAHEVAHTVQQGTGPVAPQAKLEVSQPGDAAEVEADSAADAITAGRSALLRERPSALARKPRPRREGQVALDDFALDVSKSVVVNVKGEPLVTISGFAKDSESGQDKPVQVKFSSEKVDLLGSSSFSEEELTVWDMKLVVPSKLTSRSAPRIHAEVRRQVAEAHLHTAGRAMHTVGATLATAMGTMLESAGQGAAHALGIVASRLEDRTRDDDEIPERPERDNPLVAKATRNELRERDLRDFSSRRFVVDNQTFLLDKSGMDHILRRHHPKYWDGSTRSTQTFFKKEMSIEEVADAITDVMRQNRSTLGKKGALGMFQIRGTANGVEYVVGLDCGRVGQFYPLGAEP